MKRAPSSPGTTSQVYPRTPRCDGLFPDWWVASSEVPLWASRFMRGDTRGSLSLLRAHLNRGPAAQAQLAVGTADTPSVLPPGPRDRTRVYSEVSARASISIRERQPRYAAYVGCAVDVRIKAARVIDPRTQLLRASTVPAHGVLRRAHRRDTVNPNARPRGYVHR